MGRESLLFHTVFPSLLEWWGPKKRSVTVTCLASEPNHTTKCFGDQVLAVPFLLFSPFGCWHGRGYRHDTREHLRRSFSHWFDHFWFTGREKNWKKIKSRKLKKKKKLIDKTESRRKLSKLTASKKTKKIRSSLVLASKNQTASTKN